MSSSDMLANCCSIHFWQEKNRPTEISKLHTYYVWARSVYTNLVQFMTPMYSPIHTLQSKINLILFLPFLLINLLLGWLHLVSIFFCVKIQLIGAIWLMTTHTLLFFSPFTLLLFYSTYSFSSIFNLFAVQMNYGVSANEFYQDIMWHYILNKI